MAGGYREGHECRVQEAPGQRLGAHRRAPCRRDPGRASRPRTPAGRARAGHRARDPHAARPRAGSRAAPGGQARPRAAAVHRPDPGARAPPGRPLREATPLGARRPRGARPRRGPRRVDGSPLRATQRDDDPVLPRRRVLLRQHRDAPPCLRAPGAHDGRHRDLRRLRAAAGRRRGRLRPRRHHGVRGAGRRVVAPGQARRGRRLRRWVPRDEGRRARDEPWPPAPRRHHRVLAAAQPRPRPRRQGGHRARQPRQRRLPAAAQDPHGPPPVAPRGERHRGVRLPARRGRAHRLADVPRGGRGRDPSPRGGGPGRAALRPRRGGRDPPLARPGPRVPGRGRRPRGEPRGRPPRRTLRPPRRG